MDITKSIETVRAHLNRADAGEAPPLSQLFLAMSHLTNVVEHQQQEIAALKAAQQFDISEAARQLAEMFFAISTDTQEEHPQ